MRARSKLGIYCPAEQLLTSQKSLNSTVSVGWLVSHLVGRLMDREMDSQIDRDRQTDSFLLSQSVKLSEYLLVN
jgi:hypothetical protein